MIGIGAAVLLQRTFLHAGIYGGVAFLACGQHGFAAGDVEEQDESE